MWYERHFTVPALTELVELDTRMEDASASISRNRENPEIRLLTWQDRQDSTLATPAPTPQQDFNTALTRFCDLHRSEHTRIDALRECPETECPAHHLEHQTQEGITQGIASLALSRSPDQSEHGGTTK
jgi:hypothetical protein